MTERNARPARHITQLERRLSEVLGQEAWRASGLGAPGDIDALQQKLTQLNSSSRHNAHLGKNDSRTAGGRE